MAAEAGQERAGASLAAVERWWEAGLVCGDGGAGRPDWAALAEEVSVAAPEEAVAPEREYPGLSGFEWVLRPFTVCAGNRLERVVSGRARKLVNMTAVRGDLERRLSGRLARAAARTLVLELYEARTAERLDGDDSRARFRDFLGRTASRRGLTALLAGRPVLARILGRAALDAADAVAEALERLADDHARLTAGLLEDNHASPDGRIMVPLPLGFHVFVPSSSNRCRRADTLRGSAFRLLPGRLPAVGRLSTANGGAR
ncbi:hypothetical protein [Streptomyces sp. NPDC058620]|uniref:hypothetical protein n=1 Tax=Streptomyces sp. NPDC058620 TaxID=3346560 RepID=UPI00366503F1